MNTVAKRKLLSAVLAGLVLGACGEEKSDPAAGSAPEGAASTDLAFATQMADHHEGAIEMAELAARRASRPQIEALASDIVSSQEREIEILEQASKRLGASGAEAGDLGLSERESGMGHDVAALEGAKPFDRAFIDAMIPHHQGAIRMARIELERGADPELASLAEDVIDAQSREIARMNEWRTEWYGGPSPAGGVPAADESGGRGEEEGHSGH